MTAFDRPMARYSTSVLWQCADEVKVARRLTAFGPFFNDRDDQSSHDGVVSFDHLHSSRLHQCTGELHLRPLQAVTVPCPGTVTHGPNSILSQVPDASLSPSTGTKQSGTALHTCHHTPPKQWGRAESLQGSHGRTTAAINNQASTASFFNFYAPVVSIISAVAASANASAPDWSIVTGLWVSEVTCRSPGSCFTTVFEHRHAPGQRGSVMLQ